MTSCEIVKMLLDTYVLASCCISKINPRASKIDLRQDCIADEMRSYTLNDSILCMHSREENAILNALVFSEEAKSI